MIRHDPAITPIKVNKSSKNINVKRPLNKGNEIAPIDSYGPMLKLHRRNNIKRSMVDSTNPLLIGESLGKIPHALNSHRNSPVLHEQSMTKGETDSIVNRLSTI